MNILKVGSRLLVVALFFAAFFVSAASAQTVRFWYHFDNPDNSMADLIAKFEQENPGITIDAENIPWSSYYDYLLSAQICSVS